MHRANMELCVWNNVFIHSILSFIMDLIIVSVKVPSLAKAALSLLVCSCIKASTDPAIIAYGHTPLNTPIEEVIRPLRFGVLEWCEVDGVGARSFFGVKLSIY